MPSTRSTIEIEGIYGTEVLGTFSIIRGFASLQELARISVPVLMDAPAADGTVAGHQRPIDETHAEEVKKYFEQGDQRFVPEIILSLRVPLTPELLGVQQVGVSYRGGGMELRRKHKGKTLQNHVLKVRNANLAQIREEQRIRRIDGNHRLAKAGELQPVAGQANRYKVPFCLLLLGDVGEPALDYTEALVFHTINSTAKPLDGELALQLILGQGAGNTPVPQQEFGFAPALHLTRLLDEGIRGLPEPFRTRLGGRPLARLSVASKELLRAYPEKAPTLEALTTFGREIVGALSEVTMHLHGEFPEFCAADYFIELAGHVWMKTVAGAPHGTRVTQTVNYLRDMARWMGADGLHGLTTGKPLGRQLIQIYDAVVRRVPKKVFLARWYPNVADGGHKTRADNRLAAIRHLVEEEFGLELRDLGSEAGGTHLIHPELYNAIGSSDIVIADMTGLRQNVLLEVGYAIHHHRTQRLILLFNPIDGANRMPFDTTSFLYREIGEAADIPAAIRGDIEAILRAARLGEI